MEFKHNYEYLIINGKKNVMKCIPVPHGGYSSSLPSVSLDIYDIQVHKVLLEYVVFF